ncbi:MAG: sulfatase-like hydrolase/transferase [Chloroflexota bacterium]|nr:sulfatase-like hydrolase/transferase [Chloroflexota bacterium]
MPRKPNIVLIVTDQQRYDTIAALGFEGPITPNLDRLVREGISFDNCFVNAPACGPARGAMFSGYWPHTSGNLKNGDPWQQTWVGNLGKVGYHTANVGKMHFTPYDAQGGYDFRFNVENKQRFRQWRAYQDEWDKELARRGMTKYQREDFEKRSDYWISLGAFAWEKDPDMHPDNFLGKAAVDWIENYSRSDPFFLCIGFPGPHPPYDPTPDWLDRYSETEFDLLPLQIKEYIQHPRTLIDMAEHNTQVAHDSIQFVTFPNESHRQRQRRFYMANVSMVDAWIGRIRASLESRGLLENTVIVFTSDHGDSLTDHFCSQKWTMYDQVVRVPAIVWAPQRYGGGRRIAEQVQWFDLGATVLDIAGAEALPGSEADSLLPALAGAEFAGREYVFSEHGREDVMGLYCEHMTMVRSKDYKLVHFLGDDRGQLFDLNEDPQELFNLWDDPSHRQTRTELIGVIGDWLVESSYRSSPRADAWR